MRYYFTVKAFVAQSSAIAPRITVPPLILARADEVIE